MILSHFELLRALLIGLAFSGAVAEAFYLVSYHHASFRLLSQNGAAGVLALPLLAFTGPFILLRNSFRAHLIHNRPLRYVLAGVLVASVWSILAGQALYWMIDNYAPF